MASLLQVPPLAKHQGIALAAVSGRKEMLPSTTQAPSMVGLQSQRQGSLFRGERNRPALFFKYRKMGAKGETIWSCLGGLWGSGG